MKQNNKKNRKVQQTRPFEGLIGQLNREKLVLVNLNRLPAFIQECSNRHIIVGLGSNYGDGKIVFKK